MFGRLLRVTGTVLVIVVAFVTPVLATSTPASADTVVSGCTIVSNPTASNFTNCPGADLAGANLSGVDLSFANLAGAHFVDCAQQSEFSASCDGADLSGANLTDAKLSRASFFAYAIFHDPFPQVTSGAASLSGATLSGADLSGADLTYVGLTGATMTATNLTGADLGLANLTGANLSDGNLTEATFTSCDLICISGSTLTDANLTDATLTNANLSGATLTGTNLTGATLTGANLSGTLLVPSAQSVYGTSAGVVITWPSPPSLRGATPGTCTPPSGTTFPVGATTVTCQVLDGQGDVATGTFTVDIEQYSTGTYISSLYPTPPPSQVGKPVTYTATVYNDDATESPTPAGGTVAFTDNGAPIAGCSATPLSGVTASCSTTPQTAGAHNITATYSGSGVFAGSSSAGFTYTEVVTRTPCATFADCNLQGLDLANASLVICPGCSTGLDFEGANLSGANLTDADLLSANLTGANFSGANASGAFINEAILTGANLHGADLANADVITFYLTDANLSGADLAGAALGSNLTDSNLSGANLAGADLTGANLTGANLTGANLSGVVWSFTTCPDGTTSDNDGGTCLGHL